jgi:AcrR family transcriptional regulator
MTGTLAGVRADAAAQHILDVAGELFAEHGFGGCGMAEVAQAAGCSRATLYRYFDSRHALQLAYVEGEARRIEGVVARATRSVSDPGERIVTGVATALRAVRSSPTLSSVFSSDTQLSGELASSSLMIELVGATFLADVHGGTPAQVARASHWLVRVVVSLLASPGRSPAAERAMVREFVVPGLLG